MLVPLAVRCVPALFFLTPFPPIWSLPPPLPPFFRICSRSYGVVLRGKYRGSSVALKRAHRLNEATPSGTGGALSSADPFSPSLRGPRTSIANGTAFQSSSSLAFGSPPRRSSFHSVDGIEAAAAAGGHGNGSPPPSPSPAFFPVAAQSQSALGSYRPPPSSSLLQLGLPDNSPSGFPPLQPSSGVVSPAVLDFVKARSGSFPSASTFRQITSHGPSPSASPSPFPLHPLFFFFFVCTPLLHSILSHHSRTPRNSALLPPL